LFSFLVFIPKFFEKMPKTNPKKKKISCRSLAEIIDHTNINHSAKESDIKKACQEAKKYNFRGICVNPQWVGFAKKQLKDTKIKVIALCDSPMGLSPHFKRVQMAKKAKEDGADEIDFVINVIDVKYERYNDVLSDLKEICKILPTKVIICSGYLTDNEIKKAAKVAKEAGAFCIKTATEKDPIERIELKEKARHIKLIREVLPKTKIKASGKIKTFKDALMMIEAGADIIGTSNSVRIIKECKEKRRKNQKRK